MITHQGFALGRRTLLALTCFKCGFLRKPDQFSRYTRPGDGYKTPYIDRRCTVCRWGHLDRQAKAVMS